MFAYELEGLKRLKIKPIKWGTTYRIKVRGRTNKMVYVSNVSNPKNMRLVAKQYNVSIDELKKHLSSDYKYDTNYKPNYRKFGESHLYENIETHEFYDKLENILTTQTKAYKLNIALGYIMYDPVNDEEFHFYPSLGNTLVYDHPITINSRADARGVISTIRSMELAERLPFPKSGVKVKAINGFKVIIDYRDHALGDSDALVPKFIENNNFIVNFKKTNNKCVFYCIAYHIQVGKKSKKIQNKVKEAFNQYCLFKDVKYSLSLYKNFKPIDLLEFDQLEQCFNLNINVYTLDDNNSVECKRPTEGRYENTMNILSHNGHAFYISNIDNVQGKYICKKCDMAFKTSEKMRDHNKNKCDQVNLESFVASPTIYEPANNAIKRMMGKYDIKDKSDFYLDHFIVFDFESLQERIDQKHGANTVFNKRQVPVSVSISDSLSNEVKCFVSDDTYQLVKDMVEDFNKRSKDITDYHCEKFNEIFKNMDSRLDKLELTKPDVIKNLTFADLVKMKQIKKENPAVASYINQKSSIDKDMDRLEKITYQTPIFGFNSGRYDINLIRNELFGIIGTDNIEHVIKSSGYMCITTKTFKMLDIINYCPAGTSLDSYLTTYLGGCICKSKLSTVAFATKISLMMNMLKLNSHGNTMKDYLIYYNNLDVEPFIKAIQKQREFFKTFDLDMFCDGVSLPGLSEKVMYKTVELQKQPKKPSDAFTFPEKRFLGYIDQDNVAGRDFKMTINHLDSLLKRQKYLCTFCYCKLDESNVSADRVNNKIGHKDGNIMITCISCNVARKDMSITRFRHKKLLDFNAKRLIYSIDKEEGDIYRKMKANIAGGPSIIFNRYAKRNETMIRNGSKLVKKIIGYDANALYLWCLGNDMPCGRLTTIEAYDNIIDDIKADKIFGFLECDIETPEHLKDYFSEMTPIFKNINIEPTEEIIGSHMFEYNDERLRLIKENERRRKTGEATNFVTSRPAKASRKLIGSYFGKKILLYTPLLKWYLDHGMVITKTYSFIKAYAHKPFKSFMEKVSDARRGGDVKAKTVGENIIDKLEKYHPSEKDLIDTTKSLLKDPKHIDKEVLDSIIVSLKTNRKLSDIVENFNLLKSLVEGGDNKSMIADMMKLVGNAAFGRSGMDMSKHKDIKFVSDEKSIYEATEHFTYHAKSEFTDGSCEIVKSKRRNRLKNPIHVSIAIYQLAKLRMLEFYYDCIDFYFDRSDFQYQEMDTDSGYIAFSHETPFPNLIKPGLLKHFEEHKQDWFPREDTKKHAAFDKRTPGLFKEEYRCNSMVSLSSKNYCCFIPDEKYMTDDYKKDCRVVNGEKMYFKLSAKGVQQSNNVNVLSPDNFEKVVKQKATIRATNKGFRVCSKSNHMMYYTQNKTAMSYYYDKRQVLEDGVSTIPLNI